MKAPTQARLKEIVHYDRDSGVFTRLVSMKSSIVGSTIRVNGKSKPALSVDGHQFRLPPLAVLYVTGEYPEQTVLFHDGDRTNLKFKNLTGYDTPEVLKMYPLPRCVDVNKLISRRVAYNPKTGVFTALYSTSRVPTGSELVPRKTGSLNIFSGEYSAAKIAVLTQEGFYPRNARLEDKSKGYVYSNIMFDPEIAGDTPTLEELKSILSYDPDTGVFTALKDTFYYHKGDIVGTLCGWGYLNVSAFGSSYDASKLTWYFNTGAYPKQIVDHIDRDKLNNRISNLRLVTKKQNTLNKSKIEVKNNKKTSSRFIGITVRPNTPHPYHARININGGSQYLGIFDSEVDAALARVKAEKEVFGEFSSSHNRDLLREMGVEV